MGKHFKLFNKFYDYETFRLSNEFVLPNVSYIKGKNRVKFNPLINYKTKYLTFEAIENSTFKLTRNACQYSLDEGGTWVSLAAGTNTPTVPAGNKIMFKATNPTISSSYGIGTFSSTGKFNVEGNIMSLLYGDDFEGQVDLTGKNYAFYGLFSGCTNVVEVHNLILPSTTLSDNCYRNMFIGCSSLITVPELPATTLASNCYRSMFNLCSSLTTAPELPATTLSTYCYSYMFYGCTSLTTAPELPATTLASYCYYYMFRGCNSLTTAPELPAITLRTSCYEYMFSGCTSLTTVPELPATSLADYCYYGMFYGCTSLITAHELPATTLATGCYYYMFRGCTGLTTAPDLPATTLAENCYRAMFYGCTSLTTAPELHATTLADICYAEMFQGCNKLNRIVMLATDISATSCLYYWVSGVASTGTFIKNKDMTSLPSGISGIPSGWLVGNA